MFKHIYIDPKRLEQYEEEGRAAVAHALRSTGFFYSTYTRLAHMICNPLEVENRTTYEAQAYLRGMQEELVAQWNRANPNERPSDLSLPELGPRKLPLINRLLGYFRKVQESAEHAEMKGYNRVQASLFDEGGFSEQAFETWERTLEHEEADSHLWDATMRANWLGVRKCLDDNRHHLTPEPLQTTTTRTSDLTMAHTAGYDEAREYLQTYGRSVHTFRELRDAAHTIAQDNHPRSMFRSNGIHAYLRDHPLTFSDAGGREPPSDAQTNLLPGEVLVHYSSEDGRRRITEMHILKGREEGSGTLHYDPTRTTFTEPEPYKEPERRLRIRPRKQKDD